MTVSKNFNINQKIINNIKNNQIIDRPIYTDKLLKYIDKPFIKVLTGMRRSGKTFLIYLTVQNLLAKGIPASNIVYINKELVDFDFIKTHKDLHNYVNSLLKKKTGPKYIFIDEVQQIDNWERAVNSFLEEDVADITVSGSNSTMLSGKLATLLSGRYINISVYPLSFKEFISFCKTYLPNKLLSNEDYLKLYMQFGGLPAVPKILEDETVTNDYLKSILNTVLFKDVIEYFHIRQVYSFNRVVEYVLDNIGNIISARNITKFFKNQKIKMSTDTVLTYINYLETAYLIKKVRRYDIKGRKYLQLYEKIYTTDIGLRNALLGCKVEDISKILENIVFNELLVRGYNVSIGKLLDKEIDFIAEKNGQKMYIQVTYLLSDQKTTDREFGNLASIKDNYEKIVISLDKFIASDKEGIKHKYLTDFLLE